MDNLLDAVSRINGSLSDYVLIFLLAGTGMFFTFRTRFVQVRCFAEGWKNLFSRLSGGNGGLSSFQALATAVAAQVGTGNIVGASGAIITGGPGAIFWMWIIAFFGMATIYAEAVLAQKTRVTDEKGVIHGGPVYYIRRAFPNWFGKFLAGFFALAVIASLGFMGSMVQANSIGESCQNAFGVPAWAVGLFISAAAGLIFIGGTVRIARVSEKLVPVMAVFYLLGGLAVLIMRYRYVPETFGCIFKYAFMPEALLGGTFGHALKTAISQGVKRGLFSNEAGMGSTPHAHAIANASSPHAQGTVAMVGVFIDTAVVLTMTALIVISTLYTGDGVLAGATGETYAQLLANAGITKTNMVQIAVSSLFSPALGSGFVAICLFFFAFSTITSWNLFGKINFHYLFGGKAIVVYSLLSLAAIFAGTVMKNDLVWELQDMFNQLMVLPNVLALIVLSAVVKKELR